MPKLSEARRRINDELARKAMTLYNEGLILREIAPIVKKSPQWVWNAINALRENARKSYPQGGVATGKEE